MKRHIIIFVIGLLCCKGKANVADHDMPIDTSNAPLVAHDSSRLTSFTGDSTTFEFFVELFKINCSSGDYSKYDYFFGNARCPLPDSLVKIYLKPRYFNKYGYYSIECLMKGDYIFLVYGQVDVSGDGFYMINIASLDQRGNAIDDLQVLFMNSDQYFKCQPSFNLIEEGIQFTAPKDCVYNELIINIHDNGMMVKKEA